ncbi:TPA: pyruvate formate lyase-activating protein, partial [Candidatus Bathyarchaeota archaeon]|nr:pyruvate formate lyase-activating protein [Candidatus Bathyarchaeota archaeon]
MWRIIRRDAVSVLEDKNARESLSRYFDVMQNDKPAKFLIAKRLPADFDKDDSLSDLWDLHEELLGEFTDLQWRIDTRVKRLDDLETPKRSFLDLKETIATRILESCHFCTRR